MMTRIEDLDFIHIAVAEMPLKEGVTLKAACGQVIPHAEWLWTCAVATGVLHRRAKELFAGEGICPICWLADWNGYYVYAFVEGNKKGR
jgi:hypothetical protein